MGIRIRPQTEAEFTSAVIAFAKLHGWHAVHFRPCRTNHGWRTAVQGDGAGWPDLVLVRERIVFCELKTDKGRTRPDQDVWADRLRAAGAEVYLWRPADWDEIDRVLGMT
jgi:hypothetical protein